jgi:hemerythrin
VESLEWTTADLVFHSRLDADHRTVLENAERVRKVLMLGKPTTQLSFDLFRLEKALSIHFASEERLMRESHYPARQWHAQQHRAGAAKMANLMQSGRLNEPVQTAGALQELVSWLKDHVRLADRMLAAHLRNDRRGRLAS